jgi:hypothetical protein
MYSRVGSKVLLYFTRCNDFASPRNARCVAAESRMPLITEDHSQGEYCLPPFTGNNHTLPTTMSVVGIDFGNQNAVIAAAGRGGVDVILNGNSNRLNP